MGQIQISGVILAHFKHSRGGSRPALELVIEIQDDVSISVIVRTFIKNVDLGESQQEELIDQSVQYLIQQLESGWDASPGALLEVEEETLRSNSPHEQVRVQWASLVDKVKSKRWDEADQIFGNLRNYSKLKQLRFFDLHYLYAAELFKVGEFERSLVHLDFLKGIYLQNNITEEGYLEENGIPSFGTFLAVIKDYFSTSNTESQALEWFSSMLTDLDDSGKAAIKQLLMSLK